MEFGHPRGCIAPDLERVDHSVVVADLPALGRDETDRGERTVRLEPKVVDSGHITFGGQVGRELEEDGCHVRENLEVERVVELRLLRPLDLGGRIRLLPGCGSHRVGRRCAYSQSFGQATSPASPSFHRAAPAPSARCDWNAGTRTGAFPQKCGTPPRAALADMHSLRPWGQQLALGPIAQRHASCRSGQVRIPRLTRICNMLARKACTGPSQGTSLRRSHPCNGALAASLRLIGAGWMLVAVAAALPAYAAGGGHQQHHDEDPLPMRAQQLVAYQFPPTNLVRADGVQATFPRAIDDGLPVVLAFISTSCTSNCLSE